jgi:hypothetical protein
LETAPLEADKQTDSTSSDKVIEHTKARSLGGAKEDQCARFGVVRSKWLLRAPSEGGFAALEARKAIQSASEVVPGAFEDSFSGR